MNSTLALKKAHYESEVAEFRGFGRGEDAGDTAWTDKMLTTIQMDVASGLRRFYYCGHPWTFLKPYASLTLPDGATTVQLPDDFGGVDQAAMVVVANSDGQYVAELSFEGAGKVVRLSSESTSSGPPVCIAQRPLKQMQSGKMQRSELYVFPTSDQDYTLTFPYFITPNYLLDVTQPFAYGGIEHHETILECCLAVAEARRDNQLGVHSNEAQRLLQQSIQIDRRKQPTRIGYNGDRSDCLWADDVFSRVNQSNGVVINGVTYD